MNSTPVIKSINTTGTLQSEESLIPSTTLVSKKGISLLSSYQWWKGIFDRVFALFAIVVLSPLMGIIAMGVRIDSPGSAIYRRIQVGENGRLFTAYKFRTMQNNNNDNEYKEYITKYVLENAPYKIDENGEAMYKVVDDPRVTRFGAMLRKTNLDELPQLFNILKGEMSLVGPRPDIPFALEMYKTWHRKRLSTKPGITGLWQVCGRKSLSFEAMVRLDIDYIKRLSLRLDAKIFLLTIGVILRRDGS